MLGRLIEGHEADEEQGAGAPRDGVPQLELLVDCLGQILKEFDCRN